MYRQLLSWTGIFTQIFPPLRDNHAAHCQALVQGTRALRLFNEIRHGKTDDISQLVQKIRDFP